MNPVLIYCAAGNRRFAQIAIDRGYKYGAQLPNTIYFNPHFTDQNWKNPDRPGYMAALEQYRPALATVLDWEHDEQFNEVIDWATEAAQWVQEAVIIIPKVVGGVRRIPRQINGKEVRLGYSASSSFSSTPVGLDEFQSWPVHCLGGTVRTQLEMRSKVDMRSADGNYIQNMARRWNMFYSPSVKAKNNGWPQLREFGLEFMKKDAIYLAFELTCIGVPMAFNGATGRVIYNAQFEFLREQGLTPSHIQLDLWEWQSDNA